MSVKLFKILTGISISFLLVFSSAAKTCPIMDDFSTADMLHKSDEHSCDMMEMQHSTPSQDIPSQDHEGECCECMVMTSCEARHHMVHPNNHITCIYSSPETTLLSLASYLPPLSVLKKPDPNRFFDLSNTSNSQTIYLQTARLRI